MLTPKNLSDIFEKIDSHGGDPKVCWDWHGHFGGRDFRPIIRVNNKKHYVARLLLIIFAGDPPDVQKLESEEAKVGLRKRFVARHKCDNEKCVNPHHLEWGTQLDNMMDMKTRERHGLSHYVVRNIRKLLAQGRTQAHVAKLYGVSRETISAIETRRVYDHVEDVEPKGRLTHEDTKRDDPGDRTKEPIGTSGGDREEGSLGSADDPAQE